VLGLGNLPAYPCWIPSDNGVGRHVFRHHTAGANDGVLTHGQTASQGCAQANGSPTLHHRGFTPPIGLPLQRAVRDGSPWEPVIDERYIMPDKDIILNGHAFTHVFDHYSGDAETVRQVRGGARSSPRSPAARRAGGARARGTAGAGAA
jgi:hypothetical protein